MAESVSITRRTFLRNTAVAGAVGATIAAPAVAAEPEMTPRQRLDAAIAELKAASTELWPTADDWTVRIKATPSVPLMIVAYDPEWKSRGEVKVYVDDGSPLLADDVTGTTAYADWERGT